METRRLRARFRIAGGDGKKIGGGNLADRGLIRPMPEVAPACLVVGFVDFQTRPLGRGKRVLTGTHRSNQRGGVQQGNVPSTPLKSVEAR